MTDEPQNPAPDSSDTGSDSADSGSDSGELSQADIDAALQSAAGAGSDSGELSQADIDAALQGATGGAGSTDASATAGDSSKDTAKAASSPQDEIDALLAAAEQGAEPQADADVRLDSMGRPFDEAAAAMAAAMAESAESSADPQQPAEGEQTKPATEGAMTQPVELPDFAAGSTGADVHDISILRDVNLRVQIELGRTRMYIEDVLKLGEGSVVELDNLAGDPVDVLVNGRLVARGEVLVLSDNFCVRINEIVQGPQNVAVA
ncbi:MAG: flagellar motor switch protein FliN [Phycisphaerae bacterium]